MSHLHPVKETRKKAFVKHFKKVEIKLEIDWKNPLSDSFKQTNLIF